MRHRPWIRLERSPHPRPRFYTQSHTRCTGHGNRLGRPASSQPSLTTLTTTLTAPPAPLEEGCAPNQTTTAGPAVDGGRRARPPTSMAIYRAIPLSRRSNAASQQSQSQSQSGGYRDPAQAADVHLIEQRGRVALGVFKREVVVGVVRFEERRDQRVLRPFLVLRRHESRLALVAQLVRGPEAIETPRPPAKPSNQPTTRKGRGSRRAP